MPLRIKNWNKHFENNRTRDLKKMSWVPFPNKHDGDGYTELMDHENGTAIFGCWVAICQVASKCDPRGTLLRDGARPHNSASLSRITRVPEQIMAEAIATLLTIGWLEEYEIPQEAAVLAPQDPARNGMEWNGREGKGTEGTHTEGKGVPAPSSPPPETPSPPLPVGLHDHTAAFCNWWSMKKGKRVRPGFMDEVNPAFQSGVPFAFAIEVSEKWPGTMDPWDIAKQLEKAWALKRKGDFYENAKKVKEKYCNPDDPEVAAMIAELSGKLSVKGD